MKPTFRNLFITIEVVEVPSGLCHSIVQHIVLHERRAAKRRCALQGVLSVASLAGGVEIFNIVFHSFVQSGFYQYLEIVFSGDTKILAYWQELGLSLVESLPLLGTIAFLSVAALFIWSAAHAARNARVLLSPASA
jgi:hypothetical protein